MRKILLSLTCASLLMAAGCNQKENMNAGYEKQSENGIRLITNKTEQSRSVPEYEADVLTIPPTRGQDIKQANTVVSHFTDYEMGSVWITGGKMDVTVYNNGKFESKKAKEEAENNLHKLLLKALPRYDIDVKIKEKK